MFQFSYSDIVEESPALGRTRELDALRKAVELMEAADSAGTTSIAAIEACYFTQRLWGMFIEDLAKPENALPPKVRADLISIGIWVLREIERIRLGEVTSFRAMIDISNSIASGLR